MCIKNFDVHRRELQVRWGDRYPLVVRAAEEFSQVQDMLTETE